MWAECESPEQRWPIWCPLYPHLQSERGCGCLGHGLLQPPGEPYPVSQAVLTHSPEAHQNLMGSTPDLCSGLHQKSCDLEGVEGATPPRTTHIRFTFKTMTELNAESQIVELTEEQVESIEGAIHIPEDRPLEKLFFNVFFPQFASAWFTHLSKIPPLRAGFLSPAWGYGTYCQPLL